LTSCTLPWVILIKQGILPRRSISVCSLIAALARRKCAQGNSDRHRSIVVESKAYAVCLSVTPIGSSA